MRQIREFRYSGTKSREVSAREKRNAALARRAAAEGMVLLKNDGLLPLRPGTRVALFGSGARHTVKGGTGSGDVNERAAVNIDTGLRDAGFAVVSGGWLDDYDARYQAARLAWRALILGDGSAEAKARFSEMYTGNPFAMPDGRLLGEADLAGADTAIYVLSRVAGEGADRKLAGGDYYLTEREKDDLAFLAARLPTVLLVNTGGPVELADVAGLPNLKAILFLAQPGQEGGHAVADILSGAVAPSGKLTATWAKRFADYPNSTGFSSLSGDVTKEYYTEGIYVGYRYFDTFGVEPLYGFGYGLSYTEFSITGVTVRGREVTAAVSNTGKASGKAVVQVYLSCPQGTLAKERRRLAGFAKTPLLAPGEHAEVSVRLRAKALASFHEDRSAWVVEAGDYGVWVGESLDSAALSAVLRVTEDCVVEETAHICPLREELRELVPRTVKPENGAGAPVVVWEPETEPPVSYTGDEIDAEAKALSEKLPAKELIPLLFGEISRGQDVVGAAGVRVPGSAGETSSAFCDSLGLAAVVMADGPAGLRLNREYERDPATGEVCDSGFPIGIEHGLFAEAKEHPGAEKFYQYCTAFPVGVLLAQSFNTELLEEVGRAVAEELEEFHVSWWLAPGMNIQRNPLCGRNFEYYSEDPLLSGVMAAAITRGVQSLPGVGTTIKHFACNNQEDNRMGSDSVVSERALREIYLRGFEIAVKESRPMCIMSSYNLINGIHAANCRDTCTEVARGEWGFQGIIMSDWTTTYPEGGSIPHLCAKAGNDLIMPGAPGDLEELQLAYAAGELTDAEIRVCARRLINVILRTNAYENAVPYGER